MPVPATTRAGEVTADVKLPVHRGALLIVTVTDEKTGQPLEGAQVGLGQEDAPSWRVSRTDGNGRARFRVQPGVYRIVRVNAERYSRLNRSDSTIRLAEGDQRRETIALAPLPTLKGVVTDPDGRPVAGAQIRVLPLFDRFSEVISDAGGEFTIAVGAVGHGGWQPQGRVIVVQHDELGLAWAAVLDESAETIRASLTPGTVLTGTVTDEAGQPLAGARVNVMLRAFNWGSSLEGHVMTDPNGRYRTAPLPLGQRYSVQASIEGFGKGEVNLRTTLEPSGEVSVEPIKLPEANLSISGTVVDGEGETVAGVSVSVQGNRQPHRHVRTDENGRFTLEGIIDGTVRVTAHRSGSGGTEFGQAETTGGSKDVTVVLGRRLSGRRLSGKSVPPPARKLLGRPLPGLEQVGLAEVAEKAEGKRLLVCVWDWHQRPSRRMVRQLASRSDALAKRGLMTVTVHASPIDADRLQVWADKYEMALPVGRSGETPEQSAKMRRAFGVRALPWLILTDREHNVTAEGFTLRELDSKLE